MEKRARRGYTKEFKQQMLALHARGKKSVVNWVLSISDNPFRLVSGNFNCKWVIHFMLYFYAKKYVGISNLFFAYPNIYYRTIYSSNIE